MRTNTPLQAFVTLNDPVYVEAAQALARRIVKEDLSVREVETQVKQMVRQEDAEPLRVVSPDEEPSENEEPERTADPHLASLEQELRAALGAKVDVHASEGRGRIVIHFASHEEFDRLRAQLNSSAGQIKSHVA